MVTLSCLLLLALLQPLSAEYYIYPLSAHIHGGTHLDDVLLDKDGETVRWNALVVVFGHQCERQIPPQEGMPGPGTVMFLTHDYLNSQTHTWFWVNGEDLRVRYNVKTCLHIVFIEKGSSIQDEAAVWDPDTTDLSATEWAWDQIRATVNITNFIEVATKVTVRDSGKRGPRDDLYTTFSLMPDEHRVIEVYQSSVVIVTTAGGRAAREETFIGGWPVEKAAMVINLINRPSREAIESVVVHEIDDRLRRMDRAAEAVLRANEERHMLNLKQPLLVPRLTSLGYYVRDLPDSIYRPLLEQHTRYDGAREVVPEEEGVVTASSRPALRFRLDGEMHALLTDFLGRAIQQWCACKLAAAVDVPAYVTHYARGSRLPPRLHAVPGPAISAEVVVLSTDVEGPWEKLLTGHMGQHKRLHLSEGQVFVYESGTIVQGHPRPIIGEGGDYVSVTVHFHLADRPDWADYRRDGDGFKYGSQWESLKHLPTALTLKHSVQKEMVHLPGELRDEL